MASLSTGYRRPSGMHPQWASPGTQKTAICLCLSSLATWLSRCGPAPTCCNSEDFPTSNGLHLFLMRSESQPRGGERAALLSFFHPCILSLNFQSSLYLFSNHLNLLVIFCINYLSVTGVAYVSSLMLIDMPGKSKCGRTPAALDIHRKKKKNTPPLLSL